MEEVGGEDIRSRREGLRRGLDDGVGAKAGYEGRGLGMNARVSGIVSTSVGISFWLWFVRGKIIGVMGGEESFKC